jgi:ABC-2 type transport system ATP-binding protein
LNLDVPAGQIVGFLGPNGAGKSTTLKMITGMLQPTSGTVTVAGHDLATDAMAVKRSVGFVPESGALFESLTGLEYLRMVAALYGIAETQADARITEFIQFFDLTWEALTDKFLGSYSKGMRRKVAIISALLHNPPVLLFDEPLDGLDVNAAMGFKTLIQTLAKQGRTVVYSSHILDVVERLCDRVVIIHQGRLVLDGAPAAISAEHGGASLEEVFTRLTGGDRLRDAFNQLDAWPAADANLASAVLSATLTGDHDSLTGPAARLLARLQGLDAAASAASLAKLGPATTSSPKAATDFCLAAASLASPEAAALAASVTSDASAPAQTAIADNIKRITTIQSGPNILPASAAVIVSNGKDAFHSPTVRYISGWLQPSTRLAWDISIPKAGKFSVSILQSSGQKGDRSCRIALGTSATERNVRITGSNEQFEAIDAGSFTIPKPGTWRLWIEPLRSTPGQPLMNIREITITAP